MKSTRTGVYAAAILLLAAWAGACPYALERTIRVTHARVRAQTTRSTGRCIASDPAGTAHMVWEDARHGAFEVYYTAAREGTVSTEVRLSQTRGESSYPAVACDSENAYVVWEDLVDKDSEILYARLQDGRVVAEARLTDTNLDSSCPVCAVTPDGTVHIAWHEGPFKQTAIYYGRVVGDSLVEKVLISGSDPEAFRPDIACDDSGRVMIAWAAGFQVKSRLSDGTSWGDIQVVADIGSRIWRLSIASTSAGNWAAAWFDKEGYGQSIYVKHHDGSQWYGQTKLNHRKIAYYPNITRTGPGTMAVGWEEKDPDSETYRVTVRCFDGRAWSDAIDIYENRTMGRYVSVAAHESSLYAVWFSAMDGSNEIYHAILKER